MIRPILPEDTAAIVRVHLAAFPNFFLSFLGPRFLTVLYSSLAEDPRGVGFVEVGDSQSIVGFVAGVTSQAGFYRELIRTRLWSFGFACLPAVARNPGTIFRLIRAFRRPADSAESTADAGLMSIAVLPSVENRGTGRRLAERFCRELASRGIGSVCLTTDRLGNDRVNRFYESLGFTVSRTYVTPEGRAMNEFRKTLTQDHHER
jgi:ribosomal protein S18 acetylase RimI-like enzyme